jgi:hypothetical protein
MRASNIQPFLWTCIVDRYGLREYDDVKDAIAA